MFGKRGMGGRSDSLTNEKGGTRRYWWEKTEKPFSFCSNHSDWDLLGWQKEKELDLLLLFLWKWGEMGAAVSPKKRGKMEMKLHAPSVQKL